MMFERTLIYSIHFRMAVNLSMGNHVEPAIGSEARRPGLSGTVIVKALSLSYKNPEWFLLGYGNLDPLTATQVKGYQG